MNGVNGNVIVKNYTFRWGTLRHFHQLRLSSPVSVHHLQSPSISFFRRITWIILDSKQPGFDILLSSCNPLKVMSKMAHWFSKKNEHTCSFPGRLHLGTTLAQSWRRCDRVTFWRLDDCLWGTLWHLSKQKQTRLEHATDWKADSREVSPEPAFLNKCSKDTHGKVTSGGGAGHTSWQEKNRSSCSPGTENRVTKSHPFTASTPMMRCAASPQWDLVQAVTTNKSSSFLACEFLHKVASVASQHDADLAQFSIICLDTLQVGGIPWQT